MTSPEMIECPGGGKHAKLPCAFCGKHAGGCLSPLTPQEQCARCGDAMCVDCAFAGQDHTTTCARCRMAAAAKIARDKRWARIDGLVQGALVGIAIGIALAAVFR